MGSFSSFFDNILKHRYLMYELVVRDIKLKYRRSVLGLFWSLLQPLFLMIVLVLIFSNLFGRDIPHFAVYILAGKLMYDFFATSTKAAMRSIRNSAALIRKVSVPKWIFPVSSVLSNFVTFLISLVILAITMIVSRVPPSITMLYFALPLIYIFIFSIGVGLLLSALSVFFRDIEHLYDIVLLIVMYTTAIFYPADIVPERFQFVLQINPIFQFVTVLRDSIIFGQPLDVRLNAICLAVSVLTLVIGSVFFHRKKDQFIFHI